MRLILVRHGQASLGASDYDRLSELGRQQSRLLGRHWALAGDRFDQVLVGPLRRHRETLDEMLRGFADHGTHLPATQVVDSMNEHQAIAMLERVVARRADQLLADDEAARQTWFRQFDTAMRDWIAGRTRFDDLETWQQARHRAARVLQEIVQSSEGECIMAVTSGGFICMAVGAVLELDDFKVYELSLELRNTAWVELGWSRRGGRLRGFNLHPHLSEPELHTLV